MLNLLIVEDDVILNNGIVLSLKNNDYILFQSFTASDARKQLQSRNFDLVVLDINLPDGNGYDLCREIRMTSNIPIIFLTANDMEIDVVTGLEFGADDYITKPFSLMILRARVSALLRRSNPNKFSPSITIDDFNFDFEKMEFFKAGKQIVLSKTEQKLLRILVMNRGNTLTREMLIEKVWSDGADFVDENALSVTINRLRNKLEDNPAKPQYIQTIYGLGYVWEMKMG